MISTDARKGSFAIKQAQKQRRKGSFGKKEKEIISTEIIMNEKIMYTTIS